MRGRHSLSLTIKNIYLCGGVRIKCREGKSLVDDEEQSRGAQKNQMPERDILNLLIKNNYAVLKKSAARKAKSIIDDSGQFCSADLMKCQKSTVYP